MKRYTFLYRDQGGLSSSREYEFESDEEALDAGSLTFERFSVQILREKSIIGAFAARSAASEASKDQRIVVW